MLCSKLMQMNSMSENIKCNLDIVSSLLDAESLVLSYWVDSHHIYVFRVDCNGIVGKPGKISLSLVKNLIYKLNKAIFLLQISNREVPFNVDSNNVVDSRNTFDNLLSQLYMTLLPTDLIKCQTRYNRLVISPSGPLFNLPFHAFKNPFSCRYVIEDFKVSYTFNEFTREVKCQKSSLNNKDSVCMVFSPLQKKIKYSTYEVNSIVNSFEKIFLFKDSDATIKNFSTFYSIADYVHFVTKGNFSPKFPQQSYINLYDCRLTAQMTNDIHLNLNNCKLITISGSNAGIICSKNKELKGLVYSLFLSGGNNVLFSTWTPLDFVCAIFMSQFYKHLAKTNNIHDSYQKSIKYLINETSFAKNIPLNHPFFWASFSLYSRLNF